MAGPATWLLLHTQSRQVVVQSCWPLVRADAEVDGLLEAIMQTALRDIPSFALASRCEDRLRVVVRGAAWARVVLADGTVRELRAAPAAVWLDETVRDATRVTLQARGPAAHDIDLPLGGAVVLAAAVDVGLAARGRRETVPREPVPPPPAPPPSAPPPPTPPSPKAPEPAVSAAEAAPPSYDHLFRATIDPEASRRLRADVAPPAAAAPAPIPPPAAARRSDAPEPTVEASVREPAAEVPGKPTDESEPAAPAPRGERPRHLIDELPWLVSPAARPPAAPVPDPVLLPPAPATVPERPLRHAAEDEAAESLPEVPAADKDAPLLDEAAAKTISRASLALPTGPMVQAVRCQRGHLSPSFAETCRVCSAPIPSQSPFQTPRPSLGVLELSTGDSIALTRAVVMGRAPTPPADDQERTHLIRLSGEDISRNHVAVNLEGWHVLIRDLGSTNGTVVAAPNQRPERLRPHEERVLDVGSVVTLAEQVSFRFVASE